MKEINRRDFFKFFISAPVFSFDYTKENQSNIIMVIKPMEYQFNDINIKINSYIISVNSLDGSYKLVVNSEEEIPTNHCSYQNYNNIYIIDQKQCKTYFLKNIWMYSIDIKLKKFFKYEYDFGELLTVYDGINV